VFSERPAGAKKTPYFPYIKKEKSNSFPDLKSQGVSLKEKMYFLQRSAVCDVHWLYNIARSAVRPVNMGGGFCKKP